MMLKYVTSSPPSTVRCRQLNTTQLTIEKSPFMPTLGFRPVLHAQRMWWNVLLYPPMVEPKEWFQVFSASLEMLHWIVTFTVGNLSAPTCVGRVPAPRL